MAVRVKVKKLNENAVLPTYAKPGDAGMDLTAVSKKVVVEKLYDFIEYGTGLAFEIPEGYVGLVFPRSSVSKTSLSLANCVGVIDSGYRGEVTARFKVFWHDNRSWDYSVGDRIAQIIILPYPQVEFELADELSSSERGAGGYGSSGN